MPRGMKINNKKIAEVVTSFTLTNNYSETARKTGVSVNSVKNIINRQKKNNPEEFAQICNQKKEVFYEQANKIIDKALVLLNRRFDTALEKQNELEELIDIVFNCNETGEDKLTRKEKIDIVKKLSRMELNNLSEITTALGTLYDKMRLSKGESTENTTFKVDINVIE